MVSGFYSWCSHLTSQHEIKFTNAAFFILLIVAVQSYERKAPSGVAVASFSGYLFI